MLDLHLEGGVSVVEGVGKCKYIHAVGSGKQAVGIANDGCYCCQLSCVWGEYDFLSDCNCCVLWTSFKI